MRVTLEIIPQQHGNLLTSARSNPMFKMAALSVTLQPSIHSAVSTLLEVSSQWTLGV